MSSVESLNERMLVLETAVAHLQHDVEQMHGVILAQNNEIQALRGLVEHFEGQLEEATKEPERRDPQEERPPHY